MVFHGINMHRPLNRFQSRFLLVDHRLQIVLGATVAAAALSLCPGKAEAFVVSVDNVDYDVTTFTGFYDANASKFQTPANGGEMPWWGNETLAKQFATAVGTNLGLPFIGKRGPFFAISTGILQGRSGASRNTQFASYDTTYGNPGIVYVSGASDSSWTWASVVQATLNTRSTTDVPAPLPIFGVAAAWGSSRQLRKRIKAN
jgi:hypothetical protein